MFCSAEEFGYESEIYPLKVCPRCQVDAEESLEWQRLTEPRCNRCSNQNLELTMTHVGLEGESMYKLGAKMFLYRCANCRVETIIEANDCY